MASGHGDLRVLLLGKTGSGKSSLGNTLMGREIFGVGRGMSSGTEKCQWSAMQRGDFRLKVTDTPGLCDTHRSEEEIIVEVGKSVAACSPGPHVVVLVFRCDKRFTKEEFDAYQTLKKLFGSEICKHMIVVFAGIDAFQGSADQQQEALKRELGGNPGNLQIVLSDAGRRFYGVNNEASAAVKERQAQHLFNMMWNVVSANRGRYFTNRMCEEIDTQVAALVESRMRRDGISKDEAERRIRLAIIEANEEDPIMRQIIALVKRGIPPELAILISLCSVM